MLSGMQPIRNNMAIASWHHAEVDGVSFGHADMLRRLKGHYCPHTCGRLTTTTLFQSATVSPSQVNICRFCWLCGYEILQLSSVVRLDRYFWFMLPDIDLSK